MTTSTVVTTKSSKGLADAMFEELDALRNGKSTPQNARAKAAIANTICTLARLEMDYARFVSTERSAATSVGLTALPLGS